MNLIPNRIVYRLNPRRYYPYEKMLVVPSIVDRDNLLRLRYCMVDDRRSVDHAAVNAVVENHDMILIVSCDESFDDASLSYCLFMFQVVLCTNLVEK